MPWSARDESMSGELELEPVACGPPGLEDVERLHGLWHRLREENGLEAPVAELRHPEGQGGQLGRHGMSFPGGEGVGAAQQVDAPSLRPSVEADVVDLESERAQRGAAGEQDAQQGVGV